MEIFYSKPSLSRCYLLEKLDNDTFSKPTSRNILLDASHIREGFRVFRCRAKPIEFILSDGTNRNCDDNNGVNYKLCGDPGRYVVEHGIRRVGDANNDECYQHVVRHTDKYIHLCFRADLWDRCYAYFQRNGGDWGTEPGEEMTLVGSAEGEQAARNFELIIRAKRLAVTFTNGNDVWDANGGNNYRIGVPGKYVIGDGKAVYQGPTEKDLDQNSTLSMFDEQDEPNSSMCSDGSADAVKNPERAATEWTEKQHDNPENTPSDSK